MQVGSTMPTIYNNGNDFTGMVRFDTTTQQMQVFDGTSWVDLGSETYDVDLSVDASELLEWAREKRDADLNMQALANENKAVQIALDNLKTAEDQLTVTAHLARTHEQTS